MIRKCLVSKGFMGVFKIPNFGVAAMGRVKRLAREARAGKKPRVTGGNPGYARVAWKKPAKRAAGARAENLCSFPGLIQLRPAPFQETARLLEMGASRAGFLFGRKGRDRFICGRYPKGLQILGRVFR